MEKEIKKTLKNFFQAMNAWELACAKADESIESGADVDEEELEAQNSARETEIMAEFCVPKKRSAARAGSYRTPPEYNVKEEILSIEEVGKGRVEVTSQSNTGMGTKNRYLLVLKEAHWLIDSKWYWSDSKAKWLSAVN
jgi:NTF2 fold immunity protein